MSNKKSLFYVTRPLELICAIEARIQFKINDAILVIQPEEVDIDLHKYLIKKSNMWNEIMWIDLNDYYGWSWVHRLKELKKESYEYLFTRSQTGAAYFVHNLKYEELYILDDGSLTLKVHKHLKTHKNLTFIFSLFKGRGHKRTKFKKATLLYKLINIHVEKPVLKPNFFSFYNLDQLEGVKYVKNNLKWISKFKNQNQKINKDLVYFIGTNILGVGTVNYADYYETLKKIKELYPNKKIVYIPHVNEKEAFLKLIKVGLNIPVKKNKYNIELDSLLLEEQPFSYFGTVSTALITLKLLHKNDREICYFNLNKDVINQESKLIFDIDSTYEEQSKYLDYKKITY